MSVVSRKNSDIKIFEYIEPKKKVLRLRVTQRLEKFGFESGKIVHKAVNTISSRLPQGQCVPASFRSADPIQCQRLWRSKFRAWGVCWGKKLLQFSVFRVERLVMGYAATGTATRGALRCQAPSSVKADVLVP
jgi:hypothetical protein